MKILVLGNREEKKDKRAFEVVERLGKMKGVEFEEVGLNQDIPTDRDNLIMIDTVAGIEKVELLDENDIDKLVVEPRNSAHDYDVGWQLRYLKKIGKLKRIKIVGIPMEGKIDYERIQLILRKLVAQDIQGS